MDKGVDRQRLAEDGATTASALGDFQMYIDGQWVDAHDGGMLDIVDPATEEVVARVANGTVEDAEAAALADGERSEVPCPRTPAAQPAAVLHAAAAWFASASTS